MHISREIIQFDYTLICLYKKRWSSSTSEVASLFFLEILANPKRSEDPLYLFYDRREFYDQCGFYCTILLTFFTPASESVCLHRVFSLSCDAILNHVLQNVGSFSNSSITINIIIVEALLITKNKELNAKKKRKQTWERNEEGNRWLREKKERKR